MARKEEPTIPTLLPFHAQLHDEADFYKESFVPPHSPLTVRKIAEGILATPIDKYPHFQKELSQLQFQLRKLLSPDSKSNVVPLTSEEQIAVLIRKDATHDAGRQFMLETILAPLIGIPAYPALPHLVTPDMLAYYHVLRHRTLQGIRRSGSDIPYKAQAAVQVNALEESLLDLPQKSFSSRFGYLQQASRSIGSILLGTEKLHQIEQELYGQLKGAISAAAIRLVVQKHLPTHTELHGSLIELDISHAIDGIGISLSDDCVVFTGQYKSSSQPLDPETPLFVRSPGAIDAINLTSIVRRLNYRSMHEMPVFFVPTFIAQPTLSGPVIQLHNVISYLAEFDATGKWSNPFHVSWDKMRTLSSHHFIQNSYRLWQNSSPVLPLHPHAITAIFGLVNYHALETWHKTSNHTLEEQQKHLIEAFYEFKKNMEKK